jgi:serralysin
MAKSKNKYNGEIAFPELLFEDYSLHSRAAKKLVFKGNGEDGLFTQMVVEGKGFVVKNGVLKAGTIREVDFLNKKKVLVELDDLNIGAKAFQKALAKSSDALLDLLYAGNDKISSSAYSTSFYSGFGNDTVKFTGRGWAEFIDGPGNDKYVGSTFSDVDNMVSYADAISYKKFGTANGIDANMTTGKVVDPWGFTDTLKNINVIIGTSNSDHVTGGGDRMRFIGLQGNDSFIGTTGEDSLDYRRDAQYGGTSGVHVDLSGGWAYDGFGDRDTFSGIDRVIGTAGNDTIIGSSASEVLEGWHGNDMLTGGTGRDIFRFRDGFGNDMITDFEAGVDKIRLNDLSELFDGYDDLVITQSGEDTVISVFGDEQNSITLLSIEASTLTESDFIL